MKRLWSVLITHQASGWWNMRTSEGDPPVERSFLYKFHALMTQLRRMMENTHATSDDSPPSDGGAGRT